MRTSDVGDNDVNISKIIVLKGKNDRNKGVEFENFDESCQERKR